MNRYTYSQLGSNCKESLDILTSNAKFIPPSDKIYGELLTDMYQYPNMNKPYYLVKEEEEKTKGEKPKENYKFYRPKYSMPSCCGGK